MKNLQQDRLIELLADQTLSVLSAEEATELSQLKKQFPLRKNDFSFELTAAAINLADLDLSDELPAHMRTRILAVADSYFASREAAPQANAFPTAAAATRNVETAPRFSFWQSLGWAFAAVAGVALALNVWTTRFQTSPEIAKTPEVIQTPKSELTAAQKRDELIAAAQDAVQLSLTNPKNEKEVVGDMVWSNEKQKGYARFRGLPANDAAKESYQLWIVDETQDAKTPISGGVFNVSSNGEVIVPVNVQLEVKKPKVIAVTREKAGGVVVSKQENVVAIAKI